MRKKCTDFRGERNVRSRSRSPTGSHEWDGSVGRESACGVNVAKRLPPERWTLLTDGNYLCVQNEQERKKDAPNDGRARADF